METPNHLLLAALWLQAALLGSVATTIAVVAVAVLGLGLLSGRVDWRRGTATVVGCFVLFGAPIIASGLLGLNDRTAAVAVPVPPPPVVLATPISQPSAYDPYAGAALMPRH